MYLPRGPVGKIIEFYLHFAPFRGALTVQLPELGEALGEFSRPTRSNFLVAMLAGRKVVLFR